MPPHYAQDKLGTLLQAGDVVARFDTAAVSDPPFRPHHDQGLEILPGPFVTEIVQILMIAQRPALPDLQPPVPFVRPLGILMRHLTKVLRLTAVQQVFQILVELTLVLFHRQHIVGAALDDAFGDLGLAARRIGGHNTPGQFQHSQQLGHGPDRIRMGLHLDLPQNQAVGTRPGTHHLDGMFPEGAVVRAPQDFPVHGDHLSVGALPDGLDPIEEAPLKGVGIEPGEDPSKGIVRGNAIRQNQKLSQSSFFGDTPGSHFGPSIGTTNDRTDGNRQHIEQEVLGGIPGARVGDCSKMLGDRLTGLRRHAGLL